MGSASYPGRTLSNLLSPSHQPKHNGDEANDGQDSDDNTTALLLSSRNAVRMVYTRMDGSYAGFGRQTRQ
jgi:hypothetical protein